MMILFLRGRGLLGDESASSASEENVLAGTVLRGENEELTLRPTDLTTFYWARESPRTT